MVFPEASFGFCIFLALLLLTVPLPWVGSALAAAGFHELCHILALRAMHVPIRRFTLEGRGARLHLPDLTGVQELFGALAGPAGSFLLAAGFRWFPRIAFCGLVQGLFNLLPIYPMDGGRILFCLLTLFLKEETCKKVLGIVRQLLLGAAAVLLVLTRKPWGVLLGLSLIFPIFHGKIPCKDVPSRVQ